MPTFGDGLDLARDDPTLALNFRLDILSSDAMRHVDGVYLRECGLDVRHLRILRLIGYRPGITFTLLASEARLERSLTSRIVRTLRAKALVRRDVSDTDARRFALTLTDEGEQVRVRSGVLGERLEQLFLTPLTREERAVLLACLDKLTAWVRQGGGLESLQPARRARQAGRAEAATRPR